MQRRESFALCPPRLLPFSSLVFFSHGPERRCLSWQVAAIPGSQFRVNDSGSQVASKPISSVCLKITRSGEIANSFGFPGFVVVDDGLFGGVERKKERMGSRA